MVQSCSSAPNVSNSGVSITPSESDIYTAVGQWLMAALPTGFTVMQGQQNFTPPPTGSYAVMEIVTKTRVATNSWSYTDTGRIITTPTRLAIQVNIFGNGAGDAVGLVQSLWRDFFSVDLLKPNVSPIDASEPRQSAFTNASDNYEDHWMIDLRIQCNFVTTVSQDFATSAIINMIEAD